MKKRTFIGRGKRINPSVPNAVKYKYLTLLLHEQASNTENTNPESISHIVQNNDKFGHISCL